MLESLFNNATDLEACNLIEKRLQHRCFRVNIAKLKKNSFKEHLRWLISYSCNLLRNDFDKNKLFSPLFCGIFNAIFSTFQSHWLLLPLSLKYRNKFTVQTISFLMKTFFSIFCFSSSTFFIYIFSSLFTYFIFNIFSINLHLLQKIDIIETKLVWNSFLIK